MQTTKFLFVTGLVAALGAYTLICSADDTPEQIQAREALRKKMQELNLPAAASSTPAAPAPPPAPAKPAAPAPPAAPPQAVAPVATPPPKKAPVAPVTPVPAPAPVPAAAPVMTASGSSKFGPVPDPVQDPNEPQLRAALRREMALLDTAEFGPVPDAIEDAKTAQARAAMRQQIALLESSPATATKPAKPGPTAAIIPPLVMEVPLSPLSGPKAERLAELLRRYDADQITPKEYHTQRAAIVAEP